MIKNIIFDFGDVFINLDKPATLTELSKLGELNDWKDLTKVNQLYETDEISTEEFC